MSMVSCWHSRNRPLPCRPRTLSLSFLLAQHIPLPLRSVADICAYRKTTYARQRRGRRTGRSPASTGLRGCFKSEWVRVFHHHQPPLFLRHTACLPAQSRLASRRKYLLLSMDNAEFGKRWTAHVRLALWDRQEFHASVLDRLSRLARYSRPYDSGKIGNARTAPARSVVVQRQQASRIRSTSVR